MEKTQLRKRIESFVWRFSMAVAVFSVEWFVANIGFFDLPPALTGILALIAGEVSKYLNTRGK